MTAAMTIAPVAPEVVENVTVTAPTRTYDHATENVQEYLKSIGAHATEALVWSYRHRRPEIWHVTLDHAAFDPVTLSLEEFNALTTHLQSTVEKNASSEIVFVLAQAIESGQELSLVYDLETGRYRTPRAARKKVGET